MLLSTSWNQLRSRYISSQGHQMTVKFLSAALLGAMCAPAMAQYAPTATNAAGEPTISASRGQDQRQLARDRYECYGWAKGQSGFDPAQPGTGAGQNMYQRAFTACMTGRGYSV